MKLEIKIPINLSIGLIVDNNYLSRKNERDGLPISTLNSIDEDGFEISLENIENLHFDNSGRYFENPEESKKQIEKVIYKILTNQEVSPVIIDTKGNVLDGQHRLCAFNVLGIKEVPVFKSLMNDTVFDNLSTRRLRLNLKKEEDFYSVDDLNKLDVYKNNQSLINKRSLKKRFNI